MGSIYLDNDDFVAAKADLDQFNEKREGQIRACRDVIRLSKKVIYSVHRNDLDSATSNLNELKEGLTKIGDKAFDNNLYHVALQEYVEAVTYYVIVTEKKVPTRADMNVPTQEYLLGLCDLCGELVRKAITTAATGNIEEFKMYKELVDNLFGKFLEFDLRNGELRKKSDSLKYHVGKLDNILYDLNLRQ